MLFTYHDLRTHLLEWSGGSTDDRAVRLATRAVRDASQIYSHERAWRYLTRVSRITTTAAYTTGTVAYDHTGGTYERELTLSGGTWPTDAALGTVIIDGVRYDVEERKSGTVVTLTEASNPGADVTAGETYSWVRDRYVLPNDFEKLGTIQVTNYATILSNVTLQAWATSWRLQSAVALPRNVALGADEENRDRWALHLYPAPDAAYVLDCVYQRRLVPLGTIDHSDGTVSLTSGSTTVTGSGTAFTSAMEGSILRVGTATQKPTDLSGAYPAAFEAVIREVASATSLTLETAADANYTSKKFRISDLLDVSQGSMLAGLMRCAEWQMGALLNREDSDKLERKYRGALLLAAEADWRELPLPQKVGPLPLDEWPLT